MKNLMDIAKYAGYFHDGNIIEIKHVRDNIWIIMKSSEVDPTEIENSSILSKENRIKGKLHIQSVKEVIIGKKKFEDTLIKTHDKAEILDFDIIGKKIKLFVEWRDNPPKLNKIDYSSIEILAEKILGKYARTF